MFKKAGGFFAVAAVVLVTVIICVSAIACGGKTLDFYAEYYLVCYRIADNTVSAGALSDTVASYGGAGYVIGRGGGYYVTVSCYYNENDAKTVCAALKKRELDCTVLTAETPDYRLKGSSSNNAELFTGNFITLDSLSVMAYECANGLDTGEYTQSKAKGVAADILSGLNGLLKANSGNCFSGGISKLAAECTERQSGFLYSKDMRYLQIAIIDVILNAQLY